MNKYSILVIQGGIGKHIQATAVARAIKNNHPDRKLIVVAAWPVVFLNLDFVWRTYNMNNLQYFYDDFIKNEDCLVFSNEVYNYGPYIQGAHIIKSWVEMFNLEYNGEQPEFKFNIPQKYNSNGWIREKPIAVIHTNGGAKDAPSNYSWARDIPVELGYKIAQDLIDEGYHVIQFCNKREQMLNNVNECFYEEIDLVYFMSVLIHSKKNILIDSVLQHTALCLGKKSCVIWGTTSPERLGYEFHENVKLDIPDVDVIDGLFESYDFGGRDHQCPWIDQVNLDYSLITKYIKE
jgi:ADP-heptose:LPS heptosyltransferase